MSTLRVLAVLGSPRENGNTNAALEGVLVQFGKLGASVERVWLSKLRIAGCRECFGCLRTKDAPGCKVKDDMQPFYGKLLGSGVVILATPVFTWAVAAPLKAFLERWYCLTKSEPDGSYASFMEGKEMFAVITASGGIGDGALMVSEAFKALADFMRMRYAGEVCLTDLDAQGSAAHCKQIRERAADIAGKQLAIRAPAGPGT